MKRSIFLKFIGLIGLSTMAAVFKSSDPHIRINDSKNPKSAGNKIEKKAELLAGKLGLKPENRKHY